MIKRSPGFSRRYARSAGFTLVEALATVGLIAIVLPTTYKAVYAISSLASDSRRRDEASGLAQSKLAEISQLVAIGQTQGGNLSGDFGSDWPGYQWDAALQQWNDTTSGVASDGILQQLDVRISWPNARNGGLPNSIVLSTLVYQRPAATPPADDVAQ